MSRLKLLAFKVTELTGMAVAPWSRLSSVACRVPSVVLVMCRTRRRSAPPACNVPCQSPTMFWAWAEKPARHNNAAKTMRRVTRPLRASRAGSRAFVHTGLLRGGTGMHLPHSFKIDEIAIHLQLRKAAAHQFGSPQQLVAVMLLLDLAISAKSRQTAVGSTIGMAGEDKTLGLMQQGGHANLLEDEVALEVIARRGHGFGAAGDHDHVRVGDLLAAKKLVNRLPDARVEATEDGGL